MKKTLLTISAALLLLYLSGCSGGASLTTSSGMQTSGGGQSSASITATVPGTTVIPASGRYIVMLKDTVTNVPQTAATMTAPFGASPERTYTYAFKGFAATLSSQAVSSISKNPLVKEVEPDIVLYAVGKPPPPPPPPPPAQVVPWGISAIGAYPSPSLHKGAGVSVAIIDTGIYYTHPDLSTNYKGGYNAIYPTKTPLDDNGHGTHVSGIIAALNNSIGVVGVAPNAGLVAVKVLNKNGSGQMSWIISGIDWVIQHKGDSAYGGGIKVANMSFGAYGTSDALHTAVTNLYTAGVTIAAAAGNEKRDVWAWNFIPASYSECMAVSAMDSTYSFAYYSNYGSEISFIAPGSSVYSTYLNNGYATLSGTSMASPHVAGCAALCISDGLATAPADVKTVLSSKAKHAIDFWASTGLWPGDPDGVPEPLVYAASL